MKLAMHGCTHKGRTCTLYSANEGDTWHTDQKCVSAPVDSPSDDNFDFFFFVFGLLAIVGLTIYGLVR